MKKLVLLLISLAVIGVFAGCSTKTQVVKDENGKVIFKEDGTPVLKEYYVSSLTGKHYDKELVQTIGVAVYKVVRKGVVTFVTEEEIEKYHLDTADTVITYVYSLTDEGKQYQDKSQALKYQSQAKKKD